MSTALTLSFSPEISWQELPENKGIVLKSRDRQLTFQQPTAGLKLALKTLQTEQGATQKELNQIVQQEDNICGLFTFNSYLKKLISLGWICHSIDSWATVIPLTDDYQLIIPTLDWQKQSLTLSRFAYLHQVEGQMVLESPLSHAQIVLRGWQSMAIMGKLAQPQTYTSLIQEFPTFTQEKLKLFLSLLLATQMVSIQTSPREDETLAQWDFHDLLFHSRSRQGRHNQPIGATYRFAGKIEPLPAIKPQMSLETFQLHKPNLDQLQATDMSLTEALETRRSIKNYETSVTAKQLGEFLYRTARIKQLVKLEQGEYTSRPYPSGGGLYELELYPIINTCTGINTGLYHYDPLNHQLCQLSELTQDANKLLQDAWWASGKQDTPQILILIAARFPRLSWKYESIAYALILKHIGVLYQTMYLVATVMGLAPCALGSGNADLFTKVVGTNYYGESSVGEFMLGG